MSSADLLEKSLSSFPGNSPLAFSEWMETMEGFVVIMDLDLIFKTAIFYIS